MPDRQKKLADKEKLLRPQTDSADQHAAFLASAANKEHSHVLASCREEACHPWWGGGRKPLNSRMISMVFYRTFILFFISALPPPCEPEGRRGGAGLLTNSCVICVRCKAEFKWLVFHFDANIRFCFQHSGCFQASNSSFLVLKQHLWCRYLYSWSASYLINALFTRS